jgi:hypothetical protein
MALGCNWVRFRGLARLKFLPKVIQRENVKRHLLLVVNNFKPCNLVI